MEKKPTSSWNARYSHPIPHDQVYYGKCMVGGLLACGVTHTLMTPVDVAKVSMQVEPTKYKNMGQTMRTLYTSEGVVGLTKGWLPTAIGYSLQGIGKFGLNEIFKDVYANMMGEEKSFKYRGIIWVCASGSAEFFADILLCPWEMIKVKVQTSPQGTFPTKFGEAFAKMSGDPKKYGWPFGSIVPLWGRQTLYTIVKFTGFELVTENLYTHVFTAPRQSYSKSQQLGITFLSGYIAGIGCAIVSQAPDNIVSQMGKDSNRNKTFMQISREVGVRNLFLSGLGPRIFMIGTLTALQWWIYDSFKVFAGLGTSGGH